MSTATQSTKHKTRYSPENLERICGIIRENLSRTNYEIATIMNKAGLKRLDGKPFTAFDVQGVYSRHYKRVGGFSVLAQHGKLSPRKKHRAKAKAKPAEPAEPVVSQAPVTQSGDDSMTLVHLIMDSNVPDAKKLTLIKAALTTKF